MFPDLTRDDVFRIETRQLWLRWPTAKDVPAIVTLAGERVVAEMTARIPHPLDRAAVEAFLVDVRSHNSVGTGLTLAVTRRSAPASLIGVVEIAGGTGTPHLGYWLGRPWWGNGLMTEAAEALVHAYFAYAGGERLEVAALPENRASRRVIEKVGFRWTERRTEFRPVRGADQERDHFVLDRPAWTAHRPVSHDGPELAVAS